MPAIGGSVREISVKNRIFAVTADADVNVKTGGKENDVQANGDGTARAVQTQVPWGLDGASLVIDPDTEGLEYLQDIVDAGEFVPIAITFVSGVVYSGSGLPTGEIAMATQTSTAPVSFMGQGRLTKL